MSALLITGIVLGTICGTLCCVMMLGMALACGYLVYQRIEIVALFGPDSPTRCRAMRHRHSRDAVAEYAASIDRSADMDMFVDCGNGYVRVRPELLSIAESRTFRAV